MKKHIVPILVTLAVFLATFTGVAHAASAVEPQGGTLWDVLQPVLAAFQSGHYLYCAAIALVALVALVRRYLPAKYKNSDFVSAGLALVGSFAGSLASAVSSGQVATWAIVDGALKVGFFAAGGYTLVKHLLISPYIQNLATKGPSWLHAPMKLVLWVFQEELPNAE
jgi:hypothetical protein